MVREFDLNQEEESHGHQDSFAGHDLACPDALWARITPILGLKKGAYIRE